MTLHSAPELRRYAPERLAVSDLDAGHSLRTLVGRAVPYNTMTNVGWYMEEIAGGAFNKSIEESARNLPLLLWHDSHTIPIGQAVKWTSKRDGLWGEWSLDGSREAQEAARAAKDGRMGALSIGFLPIQSRWDFVDEWDIDNEANMDRVTRVEGRLLETSLVSTPAYADALVTEVRSAAIRTSETPRPGRRAIPVPSAYRDLSVGVSTHHRVHPDLVALRRWRDSLRLTEDFRTAAQTRR